MGPVTDAGRAQRGYTLVELLVVVVIIGIVLTAAGLSWRSDATELLRTEAQRLARQLELAQARARIGGERIGFSTEPQRYRFWIHDGAAGWREIDDDHGLRSKDIDSRVSIAELRVGGLAVGSGERIGLSPHAGATLSVRLRTGQTQALVTSGRFDGRMDVSVESDQGAR